MSTLQRTLIWIAGLALLAGCAAAGIAPPSAEVPAPLARNDGPSARFTVTIAIPAKTGKVAHYVSASTQSIAITVVPSAGGALQTFYRTLGKKVGYCKPKGASTACTVKLALTTGKYNAGFTTYAGPVRRGVPTGAVLSTNSYVPIKLPASGLTLDVNALLDGVPASASIVPAKGSLLTPSGQSSFSLAKCASPQSVTVLGIDAAGNGMTGAGAPKVTLTSSAPQVLAVKPGSTASTFTLSLAHGQNAGTFLALNATATIKHGGTPVSTPFEVTLNNNICGIFTSFQVPTGASSPTSIAPDPAGAMWFTETAANQLGHITTNGTIHEFPNPQPSSSPTSMILGPSNFNWFVLPAANRLATVDTLGTVSVFLVPTPLTIPNAIVYGPDGADYFTELHGNNIGRIKPYEWIIAEYPIPTLASAPGGIASGPDGAVWFTENGGNKIGRMTTGGTMSEFPLPTPNSGPAGIAAGSDGALWFSESNTAKIGRITTAGSVAEFAIPGGGTPAAIISGPENALWFAVSFNDGSGAIGSVTPAGAFTMFPVPDSAQPGGLTVGPDGAIWFTEPGANAIVRLY